MEGDAATDVGDLIQKLALNFVRGGIKERDPLTDAVHVAPKDIFPDMTREQTRDGMYEDPLRESSDFSLATIARREEPSAVIIDLRAGTRRCLAFLPRKSSTRCSPESKG